MRLLPVVALVLTLAMCDGLVEGDEALVAFGDDYEVLQAQPGPAIEGDRLRVTVQYGGGCAAHTFTPRSRTGGGVTEVWLVHDADGDACDALLTETLDLPLPRGVAGARRVLLLTPGGAEVRLR